MKANRSEWYFPRDWSFFLALQALPFVSLFVASLLVWFVLGTRQGDLTFVWIAMGLAVVGILLLFLARLPLYRQGRFLTFGSRALPEWHRKVYRIAYGFIGISVILMLALLAILR
jgi:hypothetical protein